MADTLVAGTPVTAAPRVPRAIRLAAHAAALTLVPSGLWRIAIALGWDSGFRDEFLHPENFPGAASFYLIGLSLLAEAFGLLTLGLIHRWGEELPHWVPALGGRRIPVMAAVIPASLGAALVTLITVSGAFSWNSVENMRAPGSPEGGLYWLMTACYLPLLAWGPLLAVVTAAYYRRRRRGR
ncbi:hypothetical protein RI138_21105 [Streptomyces sp. C11-1]|uniref:Uncharacterized protein n=1 Tax=Streptomyces durocortorensis TaxID=2811104 RepID=A0ABY9VYZ1_9ACTN|nr:hypothetical protein [Streptomyces durocortorensis]WNF29120.1 hypothetical protein RI138_21105 [Streptomyces durocortorensis]